MAVRRGIAAEEGSVVGVMLGIEEALLGKKKIPRPRSLYEGRCR